jgi:hypothetical protein
MVAAPCAPWHCVRGPVRNGSCGRPFNGIVRRHQVTVVAIEAFAKRAREFVTWICDESAKEVVPREALSHVVAIYSAGLSMPPAWTEGLSEDLPDSDVSEAQLASVKRRISKLPVRFYSEIFDPFEQSMEEAVVGDLVDDFSDIFRDVATGLMLFDRGEVAEAQWQWAFNFRIHWGKHAASAIRALHGRVSEEDDGRKQDDA